jgi:signal transduction histidine kinase
VPVGQLLGQQPPRPGKWRALTRWRDWSLPVKLSAVTVVPILIALVLGTITIVGEVERSDTYQRIDRLVVLDATASRVLDAVQRERAETAQLLTEGTSAVSPELESIRSEVDGAIPKLSAAVDNAAELDGSVTAPSAAVADQLARLPGIREQIEAGRLSAPQAVSAYTEITGALLNLDTSLAAGISDEAIGGTPRALHDLRSAGEQAALTRSLLAYGIDRGALTPAQLGEIRNAEVRLNDSLEDFRATASRSQLQDFERTVAGTDLETRQSLVAAVLDEQGVADPAALETTSPQEWSDSSAAVIAALSGLADRLAGQMAATSAALVDDSSSGAGVLAVLLFAALVLAAVVVFVIARQLLRSLRLLRNSALDVANNELPAAVRNIQDGRTQSTDVHPVPVTSADEVGEVARAFDAVHSQALRLAVEQASMRTGFSSVFVNLSRRSQSLVQRQLQLIERLERDEEDADQLAILFQLDHLATRMRRNNENLMVLSGEEPGGRRSGQPVTATDVLRAAVSEIEQYQRVVVRTPPPVRVVGYAAGDLMRLIAELLDNATSFSAPDTQVTVVTAVADTGGLSIDIMDQGIGMSAAELAEANVRLTEAGSVDLATSRRMGLFVVGRLASRHRFGVTLHGGTDITGVRATVTVPADLVTDLPDSTGTAPAQLTRPPQPPAAQPSVAQPPTAAGAPLPRRRRPANGASRTGALPAGQATPAPLQRSGPAGGSESPAEISGAALFSPIERDEPTPASAQSTAPPAERTSPSPAPEQAESAQPPAAPTVQAPSRSGPGTDLPAGKELFAANGTTLSDWWNKAAEGNAAEGKEAEGKAAQRRPERPASVWQAETTPIFNEMLSAWFRSTAPAPGSANRQKPGWDFASDENWRTVQAVSRNEPETFTSSGLPRRRRGEQLLPGSAAASGKDSAGSAKRTDLPVRDPADVRGRLSSFQQGVHRARSHTQHNSEPQADTPESRPQQTGPAAALPTRSPATSGKQDERSVTPGLAGRGGQEPSGASSAFTPSGLPRRQRGEQLLPGSAASANTAPGPRRERDPEDVRGRLNSFQQGVRRGRHHNASANGSVGQPGNAGESDGPGSSRS